MIDFFRTRSYWMGVAALLLLAQPAQAAPHRSSARASGAHHSAPAHHSAAAHHAAPAHPAAGSNHGGKGRHRGRAHAAPGRHGQVTHAELPLETMQIDSAHFDAVSTRFLRGLLALYPVNATQAGYHVHVESNGAARNLDHALDDVSRAGFAAQCSYQRVWLTRFEQVDARQLNAGQRADLAMLLDNLRLGLLECLAIQNFRHRPDQFVETLGASLFNLLSQTPADSGSGSGDSLDAALDRLAQFPRFLGQAQQTLVDTDPIYAAAASEEIAGTLDLIDHHLRERAAASPATANRYATLAPAAQRALKNFDTWVTQTLVKRPTSHTWRLGGALYTQQFNYTMHAAIAPDGILQQAEQELQAVRADMYTLALPQHQRLHPDHTDHGDLPPLEQQNRVIGEVLEEIANDHVDAANLRTHIEADLGDIAAFIRTHPLLTLGSTANLKVIDTPAFLRASYSVAGFHAPPPLDPAGEAQYWVTPIGADQSPTQVESRLREYNNPTLKWLSIHEALPGHYVQFEHANRIEPEDRRLLRSQLGNGAYVEGWAEYIGQQMSDAGYQAEDWRFRLAMRKIRLRLLANTILDVSLHTRNMSDADALHLMTGLAFQTRAEAEGKLRRAKLSAVQLSTYYVGLIGWQALRREVEAREGSAFDVQRFHDRALAEGPVPLAVLRNLLLPSP